MVFEAIQLTDKRRIDALRAMGCHTASSHAFSSLYLWCEEKGYTVAFYGDAFMIREKESYFFPCGDAESVKAALCEIVKTDPHAVFRYARESDVALAKALFGEDVSAELDTASREYLYDRVEQIEMKGKKFTYQRAKCNKARRLGVMESYPLTPERVPDALRITKAWAASRADAGEDTGDTEMTLRALSLIEPLSLVGNILYLDAEPIGFDLGAMIAPDTLDNHIAKTLRNDVDALMKLLWYESLPDTVRVINREEDLGIRGLRIHKMDAQPCGFNDTYTLSFSV